MAEAARQPYVFVSYASADRDRVLPVVERLEAAGIAVWIDRDGIHGGANYALEIAEAIEHAAALVLMCSRASLASRNVKQEIALGWRFEKTYLPLLLDPVEIPKDVAYWLEGSQWIELLDRADSSWLADVVLALAPLGITLEPAPAAARPRPAPPRERPLLVGRERAQAVLTAQLDRMLAGQGGTVLVGGEAGIGKTTLVEDLGIVAEEAGALVFWGHAYDLSVTPPYGPWLEIFRRYGGVRDDALPPVPAFVGNPEELAKVGSQETLFAAMADFFRAVASQRPLLLVLDDLHWADPASLDFFRVLARLVPTQPLLLVATCRSDELTRRHPLYTLLPLLVREAGAIRLDVRPLDAVGHRTLIASRYAVSDADRDRLERYLAEHAEGNPLYAGELLRTLEEEGVLTRNGDGWALGDLERARVPPLLMQVIEGRLGRLDEDTRGLLQIAAVIGQEVPLELWQRVSGAGDEALVAAIEQGQSAQLLAEATGGTSYRFRQALIREALYEEVVAPRRRVWHRQVGEVLAETHAPDPDMVAYHFARAGDDRAATWLIKAGQRAQQAYVWKTAVERFETALDRLTEQGAPLAKRAMVLYRLAFLLRFSNASRALAQLDDARRLAGEAGERGLAGYFHYFRGLLQCFNGDVRSGLEAMELGNTVLTSLAEDDLARLRSLIDVDGSEQVGTVVLWLALVGRLAEARTRGMRLVQESPVPLGRSGEDGSDYADALQGLTIAEALLGRPDAAQRASHQARDLYRAIQDHAEVAGTCGNELELVQLPYFPDQLAQRRRLAEECAAAGQRAIGAGGGIPDRSYVLPLLVLDGAWTEAREVATRAEGSPSWGRRLHGGRWRAGLARLQGDRAVARQILGAVLPDGPRTTTGDTIVQAALSLQRLAADLALDGVDLPAARAWLEAHDRWLDWSGAVLGRAEGALVWSRYHRAAGDTAAARQRAEEALAHASEPRQPLALIAVHRCLGALATEAGQLESAEEHLRHAHALADACAAPFERALTLLEFAGLRAAQGRTDEARTLLAEVRVTCEPLQAKPTLERADALEARLAGAAGA
ncbi:MAG TPA: AAA family ATPase [Thermomicrobiaceae bacterium]|nr:AAA family ATPase [Thermomicrobiaceae bacterium]